MQRHAGVSFRSLMSDLSKTLLVGGRTMASARCRPRFKSWRSGFVVACGAILRSNGVDEAIGSSRRRGVSVDLAWNTAKSAHGPWRLSQSPALTSALPARYFRRLDLPRLVNG